jgi:hypothetical protein
MMSARKTKAPAKPAGKTRGTAPKTAAPAQARAPRKGGRWVFFAILLLALGLAGQGAWVYLRNVRSQVQLIHELEVAGRGQGKGQVTGARHLAADGQGNLLYLQGVNETSLLQKFSPEGKWLAWTGDLKPADKPFNAFAVAGDAQGNAWVVERGSGKIRKFGPALEPLAVESLPSTDLTGVAIDSQGRAWAAAFNGKLFVVTPDCKLERTFSGDAEHPLLNPFRLCFDGEDTVYVACLPKGFGSDPLVRAFRKDGSHLASWTAEDLPANEFLCIGWDPQGLVALNDNRGDVANGKGFQLRTPKGKLKAMSAFSNSGWNLRTVPGFTIARNGKWFLDLTILQMGCNRFTLAPVQ